MNTFSISLYGIPHCDTVKKARAWLTAQGFDYSFHDFSKEGVPVDRLPAWFEAIGWDQLVNRKGTTWRRLDDQLQASVCNVASASQLVQAYPSVIKRPVVEWRYPDSLEISVGFAIDTWALRLPKMVVNA